MRPASGHRRPASAALVIATLAALSLSNAVRAGDTEARSPFATSSDVRLEPVFVIGGEEEPDDDRVLYQPMSVAVDAAGNLFVVDRKMSYVKKFSPAGELLVTFGRDGEGPGEFRRGGNLIIDPNGNVLLYDGGNRRFVMFDNDGAYLETYGFQRSVWGADMGVDGTLYVMTGEGDHMTHVYHQRLVQCDLTLSSETVLDSLEVQTSIIHTQGDRTIYMTRPYLEGLAWCVRPDGGVVVGPSTRYLLRALDGAGNEVARFTRDIEQPRLTKEAREAYIADLEARDASGTLDYRGMLEFPDRKPYFEQVYADPDGTTLVLRYRDKAAPATLDVFSADGRFLHEVTLDRFPIRPVFRGDSVFGLLTGPEDLPRAVRLKAGSPAP
jgi:hypothetical protein